MLWEDRRVTGRAGMAGARRMIEIVAEGEDRDGSWTCGMEFQYANRELLHARPRDAKDMSPADIEQFPPAAARNLDIVFVPPFSGIEREEPRRDAGLQDLLIGQGRPGEILRNLVYQVSARPEGEDWRSLSRYMNDLFRIELQRPVYSAAQPFIVSEYREQGRGRPLDLANVGSGTLQVLLILAFLYARPASVILLDEPDAHQHVILQREVYDLIRKVARERGGQVILATHSEVENEFWKQVPPGTDLFGDHVSLVRVKASNEFLVPLFELLRHPTQKKDLYLLAARMRPEEIHPEVTEKLDRIAEALDLPASDASAEA